MHKGFNAHAGDGNHVVPVFPRPPDSHRKRGKGRNQWSHRQGGKGQRCSDTVENAADDGKRDTKRTCSRRELHNPAHGHGVGVHPINQLAEFFNQVIHPGHIHHREPDFELFEALRGRTHDSGEVLLDFAIFSANILHELLVFVLKLHHGLDEVLHLHIAENFTELKRIAAGGFLYGFNGNDKWIKPFFLCIFKLFDNIYAKISKVLLHIRRGKLGQKILHIVSRFIG